MVLFLVGITVLVTVYALQYRLEPDETRKTMERQFHMSSTPIYNVRSIDYNVVKNGFVYHYQISPSSEEDSYTNVCMVFETEYDEAFAHWIFESAIHLFSFQEMRKTYPSAKLLMKSKKKYKELILRQFQLSYDDVLFELPTKNACIFCPVFSLNDRSIPVTTFMEHVRRLKDYLIRPSLPSLAPVSLLYLPRSQRENFTPNDRTIVSSNEIQTWCLERGGEILHVDTVSDFTDQVRKVRSAREIILDYGSSLYVNGLLAQDGARLIVLGNMHQHETFPSMAALMEEIQRSKSVTFINPLDHSTKSELAFDLYEIEASFVGHVLIPVVSVRTKANPASSAFEILTYGDSHSKWTFENLVDIPFRMHWLGPVLMHRIGRDGLYIESVESESPHVILLFAFGEIDIRCHVGKQVEKGRNIHEVLNTLAERYVQSLNRTVHFLRTNPKMHFAIMSVLPPAVADPECWNPDFPFIGSDQQRSDWTKELNTILSQLSEIHNYYFLDMYTDHADEHGMLFRHYSDGHVHIKDSPYVEKRVRQMMNDLDTK